MVQLRAAAPRHEKAAVASAHTPAPAETQQLTRRQLRSRQQLRRARKRVGIVPILIVGTFLVGAIILLYPTIANWINQSQYSGEIVEYSTRISGVSEEELAAIVDAARDYNRTLNGSARVGANQNVPTASGDSGDGYWSMLRMSGSPLMARIKIPAVNVDLPVFHGTSERTLLNGVGHLQGTALPVGGEGTHAVLTAHRGLADAELFTNLDRVVSGDTFTIEVFGEVLTYRVVETKIVEPSETEALAPIVRRDLVTLVTCTPIGINTQRILVTAEREEPTPQADLDNAGAVPDVPGFPWWALVLLGVAVLGAGYLWIVVRRARTTSSSKDNRYEHD